MVKGFVGLLMLLPSLVLGVPYATLAEHWGIKRVLLLSIAGIFLGELWYDLVCWYGRSLPVELIYLTPVFYLIGGGASVGVSLLFVLVANASPAHLRPTRFFIMEASSVSGAIFGYMASSAIMDTLLWAPVLLGLGLIFLSFCLLLPVPDQRPLDAEPPEEGMLEPASDDDTPKSTVRTLHTAVVVLKGQGSLVILLLGYLLRSLGGSVMTLMIIYSAQAFNWSFSRSGYLASLDSTAHLAVLLLLPPLQRLLLSQSASDGTSNLFALARGSALLLAVGCAGMALAPSPAFFAISIVLYSLGGGYSQSIRSILTASTPDEHRAITYTVMGILDTVGTMVGAPVWPLVYRVGLKLAGPWIGLPFVTAAALFGGVYLTLFAGRQVNAVE
ncbi:major facilitator superfamily domain-containing protein [Aspergillus varians]